MHCFAQCLVHISLHEDPNRVVGLRFAAPQTAALRLDGASPDDLARPRRGPAKRDGDVVAVRRDERLLVPDRIRQRTDGVSRGSLREAPSVPVVGVAVPSVNAYLRTFFRSVPALNRASLRFFGYNLS